MSKGEEQKETEEGGWIMSFDSKILQAKQKTCIIHKQNNPIMNYNLEKM